VKWREEENEKKEKEKVGRRRRRSEPFQFENERTGKCACLGDSRHDSGGFEPRSGKEEAVMTCSDSPSEKPQPTSTL
jgi:hypothetical protein